MKPQVDAKVRLLMIRGRLSRFAIWCKENKKDKLAQLIFDMIGVEVPKEVVISKGLELPHGSCGLVIHKSTIIGPRVKIYQGVTIGRADVYNNHEKSQMQSIEICEGAIICAGAKILSNKKKMTIGANSIIASNSVLLNSIGENEIWAGVPAKFVKMRKISG